VSNVTRRSFIKTGTAAALGATLAAPSALGANERIRLGAIGTANRGGQIIEAALEHADAELVALCDVDQTALEKQNEQLGGGKDLYRDYRELIARDDIDAVLIASPDHWHALQTIHACEAGKDVYIEKPLSETIVEGRRMVEKARETERVVQVGLQRRSAEIYHELHEYVRGGNLGKVTVARAYRTSNMFPLGIGKAPDSTPPDTLDWDMWLGPRAARPYKASITPYRFRWWDDYSSQVGNWGVHYFDLIRWMIDVEAPVSVCAMGGRYAVDDDRTIPDTMECTFELPGGALLIFGQYEASGVRMLKFGDIELRGTQGLCESSQSRFEVTPERGGQFQDTTPRMEPYQRTSEQPDSTIAHMRNFFDCIKSRQRPHCDVEEGHRSTVFAHLANISLATRSRLDWDSKAERITNNEAANALLHYEYRAPWKL